MSLKHLFRRVDLYLRNEPFSLPEDDHKVIPIEVLFDKDPVTDPFRTRAYWAVRRFWSNHWLCNPRKVWFDIVCAYQRVTRGWDDRAVWGIDSWLDEKMPDMLRKLKTDKHGIPMDMFDGLPVNDEGYHSEPEMGIAEKRWNAILDKMIAGFEANRRISDSTYEDELGPYPVYRPEGMDRETWKVVQHEHYLKTEKLRARDELIFKEGIALFAEHYRSLWD